MDIQFNAHRETFDDLVREIGENSDLIVEGGAGTQMGLLCLFRELGYEGPYVRTDLMYPNKFDGPRTFADKGGTIKDYYACGINCFREDHMNPVFSEFQSKKPSFVSINALTNALFARAHLTSNSYKTTEDRIPILTAVQALSKFPYQIQLHATPMKSGLVAHINSQEIIKIGDVERYPHIKIAEQVIVLDTQDDSKQFCKEIERLKEFLQESISAGWTLSVSTTDYGYIYMTRKEK